MTWLLAALVVAAVVGTAIVLQGRGAGLGPAESDRPASSWSAPLRPADLRAVRLPVVLRGYRMADVDALLAALADQLEDGAGPDGEREWPTTPGDVEPPDVDR